MTYIFSNGDVADGSHVNDNFNKLNKLTNEKAINDVSATNSGVLAGSSQVLIDKFLDANGQNNTVDTGTTTAEYRPGKLYVCIGTSSISEPSFETVSSWTYSETDSDFTGARDSGWASKGTYSYKFTNGGGSIGSNTYAQILQSTDVTDWESVSLDYNITAISGAGEMTLQLIIGNTIIASVPLTVSSGTLSGDCSAINGTQNVIIKVLAGAGGVSNNPMVCYVDNLTTQYASSVLQSKIVKSSSYIKELTTQITNGNFETGSGSSPTGWTYSETDASGVVSGAINTSSPISGSQDYKFSYSRASGGEVNFIGKIAQTINFDYVNKITLDFKKSASSGTGYQASQFTFIVGATGFEVTLGSSAISTTTYELDCSALTGNQTLYIQLKSTGSGGTAGALSYTCEVDNVRVYGDPLLNCDSGKTKCLITPLLSESLKGTDTITADVSLDYGSNYTTGIPINTWSEITSTTGQQMLCKLNITPGSGTTTPKVMGWRVLME
jgi:hypothetical protein